MMTSRSRAAADAPAPEDRDQLLVKTPYGKGLVVRTRRPGITGTPPTKEVRLLEWENAAKASRVACKQYAGGSIGGGGKSPPMLYTAEELEGVDPAVGDDVICQFGRGAVRKIVNVRIVPKKKKAEEEEEDASSSGGVEEDKKDDDAATSAAAAAAGGQESSSGGGKGRLLTKYEVELTSWRLAGRSRVKCYLYGSAVRVLRRKMLGEMDPTERVEFAQRQKAAAGMVFKDKQYQAALNVYAGAVDAVRYVQHDATSSNETRADLVEVMVTCSNNAATCCIQLGRWAEAAKFAQNALVLLDALRGKVGKKIHTILTTSSGLCDAKLFGEWRVKSYLVIARAQAESKDYTGAIEILKRAREIVAIYCGKNSEGGDEDGKNKIDEASRTSLVHLRSQDKEVRRLMTSCIERKKAEKKREKQRAQAMFASPAKSDAKEQGSGGKMTSTKVAAAYSEDQEEKKDASSPPTSFMRDGAKGDPNTSGGGISRDTITTPAKSRAVPRQSSLRKNRPPMSVEKRVSFSEEVAKRQIVTEDEDWEEEEEETFLEQNKEALILVGLAGVAALSITALRSYRR